MSTPLTIGQALGSLSMYPVPEVVVRLFTVKYGLHPDQTVSAEVQASSAYRLAKADVLYWISRAPNIAQGGQNYNLSEDERKALLSEANCIYAAEGVDTHGAPPKFGYKGEFV